MHRPRPQMYDAAHMGASMDTLKGFRTLPAADRARLAAATRERRFERGATVFVQGQPADDPGRGAPWVERVESRAQLLEVVDAIRVAVHVGGGRPHRELHVIGQTVAVAVGRGARAEDGREDVGLSRRGRRHAETVRD